MKTINVKKLKKEIINILLSTVIFTIISILVHYYTSELKISLQDILTLFLFIIGVVTIGTLSHVFIIHEIAEKICGDNKAFLRFLFKVFGIALVSIPLSSLYIYFHYVIYFSDNIQVDFFTHLLDNIPLITIINYSFLLSDEAVYWYKRWKRILIDKNKIEKETYRLEYENLKGHINPHFMFNSFAGLTSYIEKDKDEAIRYVEDLSDFFRNILLYKSTELIPLDEELTIAKTYFNLEQRRHKEAILLTIDVDSVHLSRLIPPMSLQLLLENAIKHNTFSVSEPLLIAITSTNNYLLVTNPYRPMANTYSSTKTGLKNLINTYKLFTDKEVKFEKSEKFFSVRIPLINSEE